MKITEILEGPWKDRSIYVATMRAIPNLIDGLKPVQRFLLVQGYKSCKNDFEKTAAVGSSIASLGYHHGEQSAIDALQSMAAYHSNNICLFEGDGNFGNKLEPDSAAAARYTFVCLSEIVDKIFLDNDLAPKNSDPEIKIPEHYLPIIPLVLINGIKGIATGFATEIPPYSVFDIIKALISLTKSEEISNKIKPQYPGFLGKTEIENQKIILTGEYRNIGKNQILITELPYGYSSSGYEKILNDLQNSSKIISYENASRKDKFQFTIQFPKGKLPTDIPGALKIRKIITPNLTVVYDSKLKNYSDAKDIIKDFYKIRLGYVSERILKKINDIEVQLKYKRSFQKFCQDVIDSKFSFKQCLTDNELKDILISDYGFTNENVYRIINSQIKTFTHQSIFNNDLEINNLEGVLAYYQKTTPEEEYRNDLETLSESLCWSTQKQL